MENNFLNKNPNILLHYILITCLINGIQYCFLKPWIWSSPQLGRLLSQSSLLSTDTERPLGFWYANLSELARILRQFGKHAICVWELANWNIVRGGQGRIMYHWLRLMIWVLRILSVGPFGKLIIHYWTEMEIQRHDESKRTINTSSISSKWEWGIAQLVRASLQFPASERNHLILVVSLNTKKTWVRSVTS